MRPIKLTLAGLHSYRGVQEIDFAKLSDLGVFGIFGPTGSGKSTILDAMTLALYASVKRAKGKQAIINQEEKTAEVSFTFSIGCDEERRIYRVERKYKTDDKNQTVKNTLSRLIDVTHDPVVLAGQANLVDSKVQAILGLTVEDFMRAVVLPQGSFSEFLRLTGAERRRMLERLFSLEKYGQQLVGKLNARVDAVKGRKNHVEGAQQAQGNASAEAVESARSRMVAAKEQETLKLAAYEATFKRHADWDKVRMLQRELAAKEQAEERHAHRREGIAKTEAVVILAENALEVKPLREQSETSLGKFKLARKLSEECRRLQEETREKQATCKAGHETAQTVRREKEPGLLTQERQMQEAEKIEGQLIVARKGQQEAEVTLFGAEERLRKLQSDWQADRVKMATCADAITEIDRRLQENRVSSERRDQVRTAMERVLECENLRRDLDVLRRKKEERRGIAEDAVREEAHLTQQQKEKAERRQCAETGLVAEVRACPSDEADLQAEQVRLIRWAEQLRMLCELRDQAQEKTVQVAQLEDRKKQVVVALALAEVKRNEVRSAVEQSEADRTQALQNDRRRMAATLAEELAAGVPCPVCGSGEHPCLAAKLDGMEAAHFDEIEAQIQQSKEAVSVQEVAFQDRSAELIQAATALEGTIAALGENAKKREKICAELAADTGITECHKDVEVCFRIVGQRQQAHEKQGELLAAWRCKKEAAEKVLKKLQEEETALSGPVAAVRQKVTASKAEAARASSEEQELEQKFAAAEEQVRQAARRMEIPVSETVADGARHIRQTSVDMNKKDKQVEQLAQEMAAKQDEKKFLEEAVNRLGEEEKVAGIAHATLKTAAESNRKILTEKEESLAILTGGRPVAAILSEIRELLAKLKYLEETAEQDRTAAETAGQKAGEDFAAAEATLREVEDVYATDLKRLQEKLQDRSFVDSAAAKAAEMNEVDLATRRHEVRDYREQEQRLRVEKEHILEKLDGRFIPEDAWVELQTELAAAEKEKQDCARAAIETQKDHADLVARHARWGDFEKQRAELAKQMEYLEIIQQTIRGNMLVEFLAQEQMDVVLRHASDRLKQFTGNRYALEMDSDGGFLVRDDANGGLKRPVSTLSGGETFQTSLALALALSMHIQLKGRYPLEFFFLDEGFGSLDPRSLEVAMSTLEQLRLDRMTIGVISHVPELQQRMLRRLLVHPAEPAGKGSWVEVEIA